MANKQYKATFHSSEIVPFAVKLLSMWAGEAAGGRPEETLAEAFGYGRYQELANASGSWSPDVEPYGPKLHRSISKQLGKLTGKPFEECWQFVDLLNLKNAPLNEEAVLGGIGSHFAGHRFQRQILDFFRTHRFLLNDADRALRMRKAGKADKGISEASDGLHADIFDALHEVAGNESAERLPAGAVAALYYSLSTDCTVMSDRAGFTMYDWNERLLSENEDFGHVVALLKTTAGYPADPRLDHRAFSDLVREPEFPMPRDHEELRAAVAVHWLLRPITGDFFGIGHPNHILASEDWCGSWQALEALLRTAPYQPEALDAGRQRIMDFLNSYLPDGEDGVEWVSFDSFDGVKLLADECATVSRMDDGALADHLESDCLWRVDDGPEVEVILKAYRSGMKKRDLKPMQEDTDLSWMDAPELKKAERDLSDIAWGRGRKA